MMQPFRLASASTVDDARASARPGASYLAGGTTLVDLLKLGVVHPRLVIDINRLPLRAVTVSDHEVTIGALARMADVATVPELRARLAMVPQALESSASQQLRNMASIGGNLLQATRCGYFRDPASACNRRDPGSGCPARAGANRMHAVLGTSEACVATHPSDLAVALLAAGASVTVVGDGGERRVDLGAFYRRPGTTPEVEHDLRPGELVTHVHVPFPPPGTRSRYVKVRDRTSYEFALASAAVSLTVDAGIISAARIAVGGVATVPWLLPRVADAVVGRPAAPGAFIDAVEAAADGAIPLRHNAYKVPLLRRTVLRALEELVHP